MKIASDNDAKNLEIEVEGCSAELVSFGKELLQIEKMVIRKSTGKSDEFYPVMLKSIKCIVDFQSEFPEQITLNVEDQSLLVAGDAIAMRKLGQSLINAFGCAMPAKHVHLDSVNQLVAPSRCSVIFVCIGDE